MMTAAYAEESDIKEGYDENTEITVKGTVIEAGRRTRGPVILKLKRGDKIYYIVTAPPWYLSKEGIVFTPGSEWEVKGSKYFGRDGRLYIVGRQLRGGGNGKELLLRDSFCKPLWMGKKRHNMHQP